MKVHSSVHQHWRTGIDLHPSPRMQTFGVFYRAALCSLSCCSEHWTGQLALVSLESKSLEWPRLRTIVNWEGKTWTSTGKTHLSCYTSRGVTLWCSLRVPPRFTVSTRKEGARYLQSCSPRSWSDRGGSWYSSADTAVFGFSPSESQCRLVLQPWMTWCLTRFWALQSPLVRSEACTQSH